MTKREDLLIGIVVVVIIVLGIYAFGAKPANHTPQVKNTVATTSIPALTAAEKAQLDASHGFQYLVSYTDSGFAPKTLAIKKGETIRFINNSSKDLWVAANGDSGAVYPAGSGDECGQSAFDTCIVLKNGEFWEFTFNSAGSWGYQNNSDTAMTGTITVQ